MNIFYGNQNVGGKCSLCGLEIYQEFEDFSKEKIPLMFNFEQIKVHP